MDDWRIELRSGALDTAWDLFVNRYRRLIFAAIRHYAEDYDDIMDIFAGLRALREDDLRRLRSYVDEPHHRARFTTWLVAVVRNLTVDWFRHRDGRRRLSDLAKDLSPIRQRIFEHVFLGGKSHIEAYELICVRDPPSPGFRQFLVELRATYQSLSDRRRGHLIRELAPSPLPNPPKRVPTRPSRPSAGND